MRMIVGLVGLCGVVSVRRENLGARKRWVGPYMDFEDERLCVGVWIARESWRIDILLFFLLGYGEDRFWGFEAGVLIEG